MRVLRLLPILLLLAILGCEKAPSNELNANKYQDQAREAARKTNQATDLNRDAEKALEALPAATPSVDPELLP